MTALDVLDFLRGYDEGWVNWSESVDTFKAGDPTSEVRGIAVGWKAHRHSLERADELGCNLFICHEPLYYDHRDKELECFLGYPGVVGKRQWIDAHGMAVVRCHDVWDGVQEVGITDSWADVLGFSDALPESDRFLKVYDVAGRSAGEVAGQVARGVRSLGSEFVGLIGKADRPVTRAAVGVGAGTPVERFIGELRADVCVVTDDGYTFWREGALAIDLGVSLVVVNHCTAEDHGMKMLAEELRNAFPTVPVEFLPQGDTVQLVRG